MKIEKEIRYYFSEETLPELIKKLKSLYKYTHSYHEVTTMYDNPNPDYTFYSKEIDGRLRLRCSKSVDAPLFGDKTGESEIAQCLITWKRRLPNKMHEAIRKEEEIEYRTSFEEFDSVKSIFENVLKCRRVSSYERIRNFFIADGIHITCDQFPYGIMLELELESDSDERALFDEINKLGLKSEDASNLSCDDKYFELCKNNGITQLDDIEFSDKTMPKIK